MKSWHLAALAVLSIGLMADSCSTSTGDQSASSPGASASGTATSAVSATPKPTPTPIPDIALSGSGQTATQAFAVVGGLTVFKAHCGCGGNFAVEITDSSGKSIDIPINVIGAYTGAVAEGLDAGRYILKIDADAAWTVTVSQPRHVTAAHLPQTYTGQGQQVVGPFASSGSVRIAAQNNGSSNFAVEIRDDGDGSSKDIPINEIGKYNGSTLSSLDGGTYWLTVDSDGSWSITVSNP